MNEENLLPINVSMTLLFEFSIEEVEGVYIVSLKASQLSKSLLENITAKYLKYLLEDRLVLQVAAKYCLNPNDLKCDFSPDTLVAIISKKGQELPKEYAVLA